MPSFEEHKWSDDINDAYLFNKKDIDIDEVFGSPYVPGSENLTDCAWLDPSLISPLNIYTLVGDFISFLMLVDEDKVAEVLNEFSHTTWELYGDGKWQNNNTLYTLECIELYLLEQKTDPEHICDAINSITNKVTYWINEDSDIMSTPRPSYITFKKAMDNLIEEAEALTNFSLKNDGDTSETSQRISIINHLKELQAQINGTIAEDVKGVEEI